MPFVSRVCFATPGSSVVDHAGLHCRRMVVDGGGDDGGGGAADGVDDDVRALFPPPLVSVNVVV